MGGEVQGQGAEVAVKLIIQPEAGVVPIIRAIKTARKSVDVFIFRFDRDDVEKEQSGTRMHHRHGATVHYDANTAASSSNDASEWPSMNTSTCGSAAAMPRASGW